MFKQKKIPCDLLIVINSLVAEGCPQLSLQLASYYKKAGLKVEILCIYSDPRDLYDEFNDMEIPVYFLNLNRGKFKLFNLCYLCINFFGKHKYRSILSFLFGWHSIIAIVAKINGTNNVCAHVGNYPPTSKSIPFLKFKLLVQIARPFTDKLICCSEYILDSTLKYFNLSKSEAVCIYNACDVEKFVSNKVPPVIYSKNLITLSMVARLEQHKDHETLIRASSLLTKNGLSFELLIVGSGSYLGKLKTLVKELDLNHIVKFLGSRRDIPSILSFTDIFIFSTKRDEGFGIALVEAMASCVPVIASDVGACSEILNNGEFGYLFEQGNPNALAEIVLNVINNQELKKKKAIAAREFAIENFGVLKMAKLYQYYLNLT